MTTTDEPETIAPRDDEGGLARAPSPSSRPKIGLALGGGVARGWAHIGVVKRLDELGVEPDIVAGTSVGALVGGLWRAGRIDALENWARGLNKRRMLSYLDVMISGGGLLGGKKLEKTLSRYLPQTDIQALPGQFVAVTAELATGHEIWHMKGDLAEAIQAAYALPGVLPPRAIDGRWLIDGALVNPLPISACRALGARLVIASGLHSDAFSLGVKTRRERFGAPEPADETEAGAGLAQRLVFNRIFSSSPSAPGVGSVMIASFNILMDRMTRSRLAGDPPDVMIAPKVSHVSLLDFDRADELIGLGRDAVDAAMGDIEKALVALS